MKLKKKPQRFLNKLIKPLLALASTLLILIALEGIARLVLPARKIYPNHHRLFCEYDALLGWRHKTNFSALFFQPEYKTTLSYNSQGIRGPEYSLTKSADEYRVAVLGDSFAEGYTVEFEDLFSEVLKQKLIEQTGRNIEVINFGVAGYSTDQELLLFQQKVRHYNPDLTILMFHDNDVWFNSVARYGPWGRGHKPLFRLEDGKLVLTGVPVPRPSPPTSNARKKIKSFLSNNSYLYRWIEERIKNTPRFYSLLVKLKVVDRPPDIDKVFIPKEFDVFQRAYSPGILDAWRVTEALISKLKEETISIKSRLLILYVPLRAVVYSDQWEKMKRYYDMSDNDWSNKRVAQELSAMLKRLEIEFIDPMEFMYQYNKNPDHHRDRLYFLTDGHWNSKGHNLAGKILADYVISHSKIADLTLH